MDAAIEQRDALATRSRIVLAAADGLGNTAVAAKVGVEVGTARKWHLRFLAQRLERHRNRT